MWWDSDCGSGGVCALHVLCASSARARSQRWPCTRHTPATHAPVGATVQMQVTPRIATGEVLRFAQGRYADLLVGADGAGGDGKGVPPRPGNWLLGPAAVPPQPAQPCRRRASAFVARAPTT